MLHESQDRAAMLDWLNGLFHQNPFEPTDLPHFAQAWWMVESIRLLARKNQLELNSSPAYCVRRVLWSVTILDRFLVDQERSQHRLFKCRSRCLSAAGFVVASRHRVIGEMARLTNHCASCLYSQERKESLFAVQQFWSDFMDWMENTGDRATYLEIEAMGRSIQKIARKERWTDESHPSPQSIAHFRIKHDPSKSTH